MLSWIMPRITLDLPFPTSTNAIWRNRLKGAYRSPEYIRWLGLAGQHWLTQRARKAVKRVSGEYALVVILCPPNKRQRDLDNSLKSLSDFLVGSNIVDSDHLCVKLYVRWGTSEEAPLGCRVTIRSVQARVEKKNSQSS